MVVGWIIAMLRALSAWLCCLNRSKVKVDIASLSPCASLDVASTSSPRSPWPSQPQFAEPGSPWEILDLSPARQEDLEPSASSTFSTRDDHRDAPRHEPASSPESYEKLLNVKWSPNGKRSREIKRKSRSTGPSLTP